MMRDTETYFPTFEKVPSSTLGDGFSVAIILGANTRSIKELIFEHRSGTRL